MGNSIVSSDRTCDEYIGPFCDPCYKAKGHKFQVYGFCKDCVQFFCSDCHDDHLKLPAFGDHCILRGDKMPQSQDRTPSKFDFCDSHRNLIKDQFCCEHKMLLCSTCCLSEHKNCYVNKVDDACKSVAGSEIDDLYNKVSSLQENLKLVLPSIDKHMRKINQQEKIMLKDVQDVYNQTIAKSREMFGGITNDIQMSSQSHIDFLSRQKKKVDDIVLKLDSPLSDLRELKTKSVDTKTFLRIQEIAAHTRKFTNELQDLPQSVRLESLSFKPSQSVQDFMSASCTFGSITRSTSRLDTDVVVPEIAFPVSPFNQAAAPAKAIQTSGAKNLRRYMTNQRLPGSIPPLPEIKATKLGTFNTQLKGITSMAIAKNGTRLITDRGKVNLFSHEMTFLRHISIPGQPLDIVVISEREAVVTTDKKSLVTLDISGCQLSIQTTTKLSYDVRGISKYNDKLVVTSPDSESPSVKLIDKTGRVYWSVSSDQQGKSLFWLPWYVSSPGDGRSSTVIVTDYIKEMLTLLNGDTGEVITRLRVMGGTKYPMGVTTDTNDNVYVCYNRRSAVAVMSRNLSKGKILVSMKDGLNGQPEAIVFDEKSHQLLISYLVPWTSYYSVDTFRLS